MDLNHQVQQYMVIFYLLILYENILITIVYFLLLKIDILFYYI